MSTRREPGYGREFDDLFLAEVERLQLAKNVGPLRAKELAVWITCILAEIDDPALDPRFVEEIAAKVVDGELPGACVVDVFRRLRQRPSAHRARTFTNCLRFACRQFQEHPS